MPTGPSQHSQLRGNSDLEFESKLQYLKSLNPPRVLPVMPLQQDLPQNKLRCCIDSKAFNGCVALPALIPEEADRPLQDFESRPHEISQRRELSPKGIESASKQNWPPPPRAETLL